MISTICLDLECTGLEADRSVILCASYESSKAPGKIVTLRQDRTNPRWARGIRGDDKELVKQICAIVRDHDVVVAHNGKFYDIPMLRTRALRWGLSPLKDVKLVDPCSIAWRKFRLKSNRLGSIADFVGIKDKKTPLDLSIWMDVMLNGSVAGMNKIVEHCEADIRVLRGVLDFVRPFVKVIDDRGSAL